MNDCCRQPTELGLLQREQVPAHSLAGVQPPVAGVLGLVGLLFAGGNAFSIS